MKPLYFIVLCLLITSCDKSDVAFSIVGKKFTYADVQFKSHNIYLVGSNNQLIDNNAISIFDKEEKEFFRGIIVGLHVDEAHIHSFDFISENKLIIEQADPNEPSQFEEVSYQLDQGKLMILNPLSPGSILIGEVVGEQVNICVHWSYGHPHNRFFQSDFDYCTNTDPKVVGSNFINEFKFVQGDTLGVSYLNIIYK